MTARGRASCEGFTLLEVLVAIAILGLGLTAILSAQTGLFASSQRTEKLSLAVGLVRCRMSELEVELLKEGLPLIEETEQGPCCEEERPEGFECEWKIEKVEMPQPTELQTDDGSGEGSGLGALGALSTIGQTGGGALGSDPSLSGLADMMGGDSALAGGTQSMAPLVMTLVYPNLKPMLEASIRRVTVTARWKEGSTDRDLAVTQFVTQPQQGGFDPNAADGLQDLAEQLGAMTGNSGTGSGKGKKP